MSAVSTYLGLIDSFVAQSISAPEFEKSLLAAFKAERRTLGEPVYPILQELFEDADAYVADPNLRTDPDDLDEDQLLEAAPRARRALSNVGYE